MGPLPSHPSLEEHWCTLQLTPGKMVMSVVLVSLVAAAAAQEAKPTPLWFLETTLTGSFKERSNQCKDLLAGRQEEASLGPIFIPETSDAHICIRFPARDTLPETWRHDRGNKGACANGCCEFLPPPNKPPPPLPQPPSQPGSPPSLTVPTHQQLSLLLLSSRDRSWTQRKFASNSRTEVLSTERESSETVAAPAVSSMARHLQSNS